MDAESAAQGEWEGGHGGAPGQRRREALQVGGREEEEEEDDLYHRRGHSAQAGVRVGPAGPARAQASRDQVRCDTVAVMISNDVVDSAIIATDDLIFTTIPAVASEFPLVYSSATKRQVRYPSRRFGRRRTESLFLNIFVVAVKYAYA